MSDAPTNFAEALAALSSAVPELEIVEKAEKVAEKSHDLWVRSLLERLDSGTQPSASALLRPGSAAEVAKILEWAQATKTPVVPFGLGSGVCGAVLAQSGQVVLDLSKMDRLLELNGDTLTARVQPGMRGCDFERALAGQGYTMGHWPQSIDI